ncbi:Hypothetical predicted protein, partial [Paramuricea clavata]
MVFYFTSAVVSPPYTIYMGIDKVENEDLIKHGWPEDVWFHVDKVSSAHVYLRLPKGQTIEDIPSAVLDDCAQLVKANSIQGQLKIHLNYVFFTCMRFASLGKIWNLNIKYNFPGNKMNNVGIVYTPWDNLKKTNGMDVGQVGFHKQKEVRSMTVEKRINEIVNRLNKTKTERFPDLRVEKEQRDHEEREDNRKEMQEK